MNYKLLLTSWYGGQRKIAVLKNNELDASLITYIYEIKETIDSGYWDYPK